MNIALLSSLRDFFSARHETHIRRAWQDMHLAIDPKSTQLKYSDRLHWEGAEYCYNRLFVGPGPIPAPPYASCWIKGPHNSSGSLQPRLMTETSVQIKKLYSRLGYTHPSESGLPPDYLAYELDALIISLHLKSNNPSSEIADLVSTQLAEHLGLWVPAFCAKALSEPDLSYPVIQFLHVLGASITVVAENLHYNRSNDELINVTISLLAQEKNF